jgi:hypothetical protein
MPPKDDSAATPQAAPETVAKEDLTPPDVKLVKVDFKLKDVALTIEAPEGAKVKEPDASFITEVLFGKDSSLHVTRGADVAEETAWWKKGGGSVEPKRYLIEQPDTLLVEAKGSDERRFFLVAERDVGGVKYTVGLTRPESGRRADGSTKAECLLALKCAKTLALKNPPPKPTDK